MTLAIKLSLSTVLKILAAVTAALTAIQQVTRAEGSQ